MQQQQQQQSNPVSAPAVSASAPAVSASASETFEPIEFGFMAEQAPISGSAGASSRSHVNIQEPIALQHTETVHAQLQYQAADPNVGRFSPRIQRGGRAAAARKRILASRLVMEPPGEGAGAGSRAGGGNVHATGLGDGDGDEGALDGYSNGMALAAADVAKHANRVRSVRSAPSAAVIAHVRGDARARMTLSADAGHAPREHGNGSSFASSTTAAAASYATAKLNKMSTRHLHNQQQQRDQVRSRHVLCAWGRRICAWGRYICAWGRCICAWGRCICAWGRCICAQRAPDR
jgi:hypothetical protein